MCTSFGLFHACEKNSLTSYLMWYASFLENMFHDENLFENKETVARPAPRMSDYYFAEPETGQQDPYSKDCGIWVAQWMMQGHVWCNYNLQVVNNVTRMRLAVDLVMGRHNAKRNEVTRMAEED
ncbi:hypothetical protein AHAS_Ahas03G0155900 [Arachis hypogaea]|nr:uncharacterized protein LOC112770012 [Arachis hypogaea]